MLKSQKNDVFDSIEKQGLSPSLFEFEESITGTTVILRVKNTEYFFNFLQNQNNGHFARFCPGHDVHTDSSNTGSWLEQLLCLRRWVKYVTRELNAQDKWKILQEEIANMNFGDINYDSSQFNIQEYELLKLNIGALKVNISKMDILESKVEVINIKLDHLLDLAKSMNKTDWKSLFIGTFISLFIQLSIDKQTGQTIWQYIQSVFSTFLLPKG